MQDLNEHSDHKDEQRLLMEMISDDEEEDKSKKAFEDGKGENGG